MTTSVVLVALRCGIDSARIHALSETGVALAVPAAPGVAVLCLLPFSQDLVVLAAGLLVGWLIDAAVLRAISTRHRVSLVMDDRAGKPRLSLLWASQGFLALTVLADQVAGTRIGEGVVSAGHVANRLVFGVIGVTVGSVVPRLIRDAARNQRQLSVGQRRVVMGSAAALTGAGSVALVYGLSGNRLFWLALGAYVAGAPLFVYQLVATARLVGELKYGRAMALGMASAGVNAVGDFGAWYWQSAWMLYCSTALAAGAALLVERWLRIRSRL